MSAEAENYLEKVKQTKNVTNARGKLVQAATRYLTHKERKNREEEKGWINGILSQEPWALKDLSAERRGDLVRRRNALEEQLETYGPPTDINGETKDAIYARAKELEADIKEGMPSAEVMRRNPPGAVDMHMRWEKAKKDKIIEWKNIRRLLEPDNDEKDYTNVEMLRSAGITRDMAASYMMEAQIPGHFAQTELAKANWPLGEPKADTVLKQAERQEIAEDMIAKGEAKPDDREELLAIIKDLQSKLDAKAETKTKRQAAMAKARAAKGKKTAEQPAAQGG